MDIVDLEVAVGRPGRVPEHWQPARFADVETEPIDAPARPVETWLRYVLPAGTRAFRLGIRHLPQQGWIDDVEVTVSLDDGTIALRHDIASAARLTIRCLRSTEHLGIAAVTTPLVIEV